MTTTLDTDSGTIVSVATTTLGDELASDHAAGATTLVVKDAVDFSEDGGWLTIGAESIYYTSAADDETTDTGVLTLATPTASAYVEGERVVLDPPAFEKTAQVMVGDFGEAVEASVPHALWDKIADGIRADGEGEVVTLTLEGTEFVVSDVVGSQPVIDGSYLDPTVPLDPAIVPPAPPPTPVVPDQSPTPDPVGTVGAILLRLPPVTNGSPVVVDIYVSDTSPVALDAAHLHGTAEGTTYVIRSLPAGLGGAALTPGATYYIVARSRNTAGDVDPTPSPETSAATKLVDAPDFAVGYLYAGEVQVDQLTGGDFVLNEGTVTKIEARGVNGEIIGMAAINTADPDAMNGFYSLGAPEVAGQQGPVRVHFPVDGKPNIVSGQSEFDTMTVNQSATFEGTTTISPGKTLVLQGQVQPPKTAPTVVPSWHTVQHKGGVVGTPGWTYAGLTVGHDGNWYSVGNIEGSASVIDRWNTNGAWVTGTPFLPSGYSFTGGIVYASHNGGRYYLLGQQISTGDWYVEARDTTFTFLKRTFVRGPTTGYKFPAIGWDYVNGRLLVGNWGDEYAAGGAINITPWIAAADGTLTYPGTGSSFATPSGFTYDYDLGYVARVNTEYGDRYIFRKIASSATGGEFQVFTTATTPVHQTSEEWPVAGGAGVRGAWYDGTRFWSVNTSGARTRYETGRAMWTSGSANREVSYTWYDSTGTTHETTPSPKASVTLPKRARLSVTTQTIPTGAGGVDDPNASRIYVGVGTGVANGSMNLEKTLTAPTVSWSLDSTVAQESATTHPPTTNGFGTAAPATLAGTAGTFIDATGAIPSSPFRDALRAAVPGDYAQPWTTYTPTFTASTTNPTLANFTRTGRYLQVGKRVDFVIVITCNATTGLGSGAYEFGLPVTARSADEVLGQGMQTGPNQPTVVRGTSTATVSAYLTDTRAGLSAANSGMTTGTVVRLSGTYEAA